MMDLLEDMARGETTEYNGKTYVRVGSAFPIGTLVCESGVPYPAPVLLIPLPEALQAKLAEAYKSAAPATEQTGQDSTKEPFTHE
jgi:hypothetical protein